MRQILFLDARGNYVKQIQNKCFSHSLRVKVIRLDDNMIKEIGMSAFPQSGCLSLLNLSNNCLHQLESDVFSILSQISVLSLKQNNIRKAEKEVFGSTKVKFLQTDNYFECCLLPPEAHCTVSIPWHVSCQYLLPTSALKSMFCINSFLILFLNTGSVCLQRKSYTMGLEGTGAYGTLVASVNVIDLIFTFPFIVVFVADFVYAEIFIFFDISWRCSIWCFMSSVDFLFFSVSSPSVLSLFTYSRYIIVKYPFDTYFKETSFVQ